MSASPFTNVLRVPRWWGFLFLSVGAGLAVLISGFLGTLGGPKIVLWIVAGILAGGGFFQILRPRIFTQFGPAGIAFPNHLVPLIAWSDVQSVRSGPMEVRDSKENSRTVMFRPRVVLRLLGSTPAMELRLAPLYFDVPRLSDGTYELMIDTSQCPIPTEHLVAKIRSFLEPQAQPPHATGTFFVPPSDVHSGVGRFGSAVTLIGAGLLFAGFGLQALAGRGSSAWFAVGLGALLFAWGVAVLYSRMRREK